MHCKEEYREETVIKKSRFIAIVKTTRSEEEARAFIAEIRKEYSDASHVCTAYCIGDHQRSSDNGEPAGTAGIPILEAIRKSGVEDITCCVVRYFGGIKLGAGGLIRAYGGAASDALANCAKSEDCAVSVFEIRYPYEMQGTLETWLRKNTMIRDMLYDEAITVIVESEDEHLKEKVMDLTRGEIEPVFLRTAIVEKDITLG